MTTGRSCWRRTAPVASSRRVIRRRCSPGPPRRRPASRPKGWPAVIVCGPVGNESDAEGCEDEVGVTANSHVRQAVVEADPLARLYWFPSQTVPAVPLAAGSGLAPE